MNAFPLNCSIFRLYCPFFLAASRRVNTVAACKVTCRISVFVFIWNKRPQMAKIWMRVAISQSTLYTIEYESKFYFSAACFCSIFVAFSHIHRTHTQRERKRKGPWENCSVAAKNVLCKLIHMRSRTLNKRKAPSFVTHSWQVGTSFISVDFSRNRKCVYALHESVNQRLNHFSIVRVLFLFVCS